MENDLQSEHIIIKQCIDGNREIYSILVDKYKDMVYNVAYRMLGDSETANDVAQESFISAYTGLNNFRYGSRFSTWLFSIVVNKCKDHLKGRKDNVSIDEIADLSQADGITNEERTYKNQLQRLMQNALNELPEEYREVVILKHFERLDYKEMEDILGVSVNLLKVRTYRGREMLKKILKGKGIIDE